MGVWKLQLMNGLSGFPLNSQGAVIAIGTFDGVHLGHQALFQQVIRYGHEHDYNSVVITFEPRPVDVLRPDQVPPRLTTAEERQQVIASLGIDVLVVLPFTPQFSKTAPLEFLQALQTALPLKGIFVGFDFRFGAGGAGDAAFLKEHAAAGINVQVLPPQSSAGEIISSTHIRQLLAKGDVKAAARMLGRAYSVRGAVIHGDARGREIGFPTANVQLPLGKARPQVGVYAIRARCQDQLLTGVANLGKRPTFAEEEVRLEAHLFQFEGDLYGETLEIEFVERLRGERRFASLDELRQQIARDAAEARTVLDV